MVWAVTKGILIAVAMLATIWSAIGFIRVLRERRQRASVERRKSERSDPLIQA
jgi:hypothetical protein